MKPTVFDHLDDCFLFGKFQGCELGEVLFFCPSYVVWVAENVSGKRCLFSNTVMEEIKSIFPLFNISDSFERNRIIGWEQSLSVNDNYEDSYDSCPDDYDRYECYSGSYAQDEMWYSDDDIDTIFDGDPSAYWTI